MISENSITQISKIFCGDVEGHYSKKSGPELVNFFNTYFQSNDKYYSGFPTRWKYVYDKIATLLNKNKNDDFFNFILSKEYLMKDLDLTEVEASIKSNENLSNINQILKKDLCVITYNNERFHLQRINDDLILIGSGGYANVFLQKSTNLIVKKLKDDFVNDEGIRSRFKREYNITRKLKDSYGVIEVYLFYEDRCEYTMERAEQTLEKYIINNDLSDDIKQRCIKQILYIMSEIHKKDIIHRDISPNNIFIINGQLKIADFGLGKDLNVFTSHQTIHTNAIGQYYYCAPEQFMMLKDADKRSDVYSLGRVINFIMTKSPQNSNHIYRNVSEKATNPDTIYRYSDAIELQEAFERSVMYNNQSNEIERIANKIRNNQYDEEIEIYIYNMSPKTISQNILNKSLGFTNILLYFMRKNEQQARFIIISVEQSYQLVCNNSYEANDPFADFSYSILIEPAFSYVVKEIAAMMLKHIAWYVRRYNAQRLVEQLKSSKLDPSLIEIIDENSKSL